PCGISTLIPSTATTSPSKRLTTLSRRTSAASAVTPLPRRASRPGTIGALMVAPPLRKTETRGGTPRRHTPLQRHYSPVRPQRLVVPPPAPVVGLLQQLEVEEALGRDHAGERTDPVRDVEQRAP